MHSLNILEKDLNLEQDYKKYKKYNNGINIRNTNKLYFLMFFHIVSGNAELIKLYRLAVFEGQP